MTSAPVLTVEQGATLLDRVRQSVSQYVVGQEATVHDALVAYLAARPRARRGRAGHGEDAARARAGRRARAALLAHPVHADSMPSDVTGVNVLRDPAKGVRVPGRPDLHRPPARRRDQPRPAKTQSALLEAMAERHVTVDGVSRPLGDAFTVFADAEPRRARGTYPLPRRSSTASS
jgi:MoxR-like ATPase